MPFESYFFTEFSQLKISYDEHFIYNAYFVDALCPETVFSKLINPNQLAKKIAFELNQFQADGKHQFDLPLKPRGSAFQLKVWHELLSIPAGETLSYGQLAKKMNTSARAIGQACRTNPIVLFIPCHRILGAKDLGGYMGKATAIPIKRSLLRHEGSKE